MAELNINVDKSTLELTKLYKGKATLGDQEYDFYVHIEKDDGKLVVAVSLLGEYYMGLDEDDDKGWETLEGIEKLIEEGIDPNELW